MHSGIAGGGHDLLGTTGHVCEHGVEEVGVHHLDSPGSQEPGEATGVLVRGGPDPAQAFGAVVDGVHRRDHRQQHLRGADVGGGPVAADVLLAGLQREAVRRTARRVHRDTHQPAGQVALQAGADGHEAGVRTAVEQRHAEALRGAHRHVGAERARRLQQRERQQVGRDDRQTAALVGLVDDRARVEDPARGAGVLHQDAGQVTLRQPVGEVRDDHLDAHRLGTGAHHLDGLRQRVGVDDERSLGPVGATYQRHRLRGGSALVEQRGVGGRQAGQVTDHGLEVHQRLEPSLADLGLVRRVGGVPGRVLEHVAPYDGRSDRPVVTEPDHRDQRVVLRRDLPQLDRSRAFRGSRGQVEPARPDPSRDSVVHQRLEAAHPKGLEHLGDLLLVRADVPLAEGN